MQQIGLQAIFDDKNFQAGIKRYQEGIGQASKVTEHGASIMSRLGNVASGAVTVGLGALTAGVGAATVAIGAFTTAAKIGLDATLAWGDELDKLGDMFGMSGEKASSFAYLSNKVGLSVDEMGIGLNTFTRGLQDMAETMKDPKAKPTAFAEALKKLGVNALKSNGQLKTFDEILPEMMDAFTKLPPGIKASDIAMQLFGMRGGSKFLDFLRQGSKGLEDARKKAKAFGLELSQKDTDAVEDFGFAMNELRLKLKGIWNVIGMQVLPIARRMVDYLSNDLLPLIVPLVQYYAPLFARAISQLADGFGKVVSALQSGNWHEVAQWLDQIFGRQTANNIMGLVNVIDRFIQTVQKKGWGAAFKQLGTGFWDWLTGKGGIISQIGTKAGELVTAFNKWATSEQTKEGLKNTAKAITTGIIDGIKALFGLSSTTNPAVEPMPASLKASVYAFWDAFKEVGASIAKGIVQGIQEEILGIKWDWKELLFGNAHLEPSKWNPDTDPILKWLQGYADQMLTGSGGTDPARDWLQNWADQVFGNLPATFYENGQEMGQQTANGVATGLNIMAPQVTQTGQNLGISAGGAISGGVWSQVPNIVGGLQNPFTRFQGWLTGSGWLRNLGAWAGSSFGSGMQGSVQAYVNNVMTIFRNAMTSVKNMFKGAPASYASGGWVPKTEMALVHAGEYVLNRQQAAAFAPVLAGANNSRTYNFNNTWNGSPASFDRGQVERIAEQAAYKGIREAMGSA